MLCRNQYIRKLLGQKPGEGLVTVKDAKYAESGPAVYSDTKLLKFLKACKDDKFLTAVLNSAACNTQFR